MPRSYAVVAFAIVYLILVFLNLGGMGELLSNLAGFVYPCYQSLQALKTKGKDDDTRLLTYWVVYAFLNVVEYWTNFLTYWVPAYFLFKTLFLVYLSSPSTNGARGVYVNMIKPISDSILPSPSSRGPADDLAKEVSKAASDAGTGDKKNE